MKIAVARRDVIDFIKLEEYWISIATITFSQTLVARSSIRQHARPPFSA